MKTLFTPFKGILVAVAMLLSCINVLSAQVIAFPGAKGYGANATGGRGGTVYHVTNLSDAGPGSFRDGVSQPDRIVVFDVGGYISLQTAVSVKSNITIAGQTAPGQGIGFKGGEISFANAENIICRYIRIRPGSETESTGDDCLSFYRAKNIIVDHLSLEFAPWNNIDGVSDDWQNHPVENITVQNSIIADPTGQQFGAHTEGVNGTWSWFNNVFANSHNRNPLAKINTVFIGNILYNCSAGYTTHTSTNFSHDIVNNYFILGPASGSTDNTWFQIDKNQSIYYSGNLKDANKDGVLNGSETTPYWYQGPGTVLSSPFSAITSGVTIYNPKTAYMVAASGAGTMPRDEVDSLVINQMKTLGQGVTGTTKGTTGPDGSLYTSQSQTGLTNNGYGTIMGAQSAYDADHDGMPDYWEAVYGSDSLTDDAMTLAPDGYTNLEHYLNWLADPNASTTPNQAVNIDLTKYAGEFVLEGGVFAFSNVISGSCSLLPDGHTVQFTPTVNFAGLGAFDFSVTTPDGVYQSKVSIAVTATPIYSTLPVAVSAPSPGDNQAFSGAVSTSQRLSWQGGYNTDSYMIYFGTSAGSLTQVSQIPFTQSATYEVSDLRFNTTYYWKVDAVGPDGTAPGQIWSFTTGPRAKLTARYELDESTGNVVADAGENHVNGLANFTPEWYPDGGNLKGAVGFAQATGPTSAIVIPSSEATLLDSSSFTVSFWVKIPSNTYTYANGKDCYLLNKGSFEANTGKWYGLQLKDGKLTFAIDDGAHKSSLSVSLSGTNDIFDNTWKNIVAVRDAGLNQISIYINGVKAGSTSSASTKGTIGQTDKPLLIGNSVENKPYRDLMDDIRFYDNALSAQDIEDIYQMKDAVTLPVALVSFTTDIAGKGVLLKWQAAAEANSDRFELQSSTDYRTFHTLEVVKAKAKPVGLVSYTYRDQNPVNGINYYRLITYDQSGKGIISAIKTVFFAFGKEDFTVFPNPASGGVVNFKLSSFKGKTTFSASLLSPEGLLITKADFNVNQNNKYTLNINRRLQPGIYVLVIEHEGVMLSRKVIIRGN